MEQAPDELKAMLLAKTAPRSLASWPRLAKTLSGMLNDRLSAGKDVEGLVFALIAEAALRPGPTIRVNSGNPAYPLRAAKHLLALGEYPQDVRSEVPETDMTLFAIQNLGSGPPTGERDPRARDTLGLRLKIAALAGGYGKSRDVLRKNPEHLSGIASALWDEIKVVLGEAGLEATLQKRRQRIGVATGKTARSSWRRFAPWQLVAAGVGVVVLGVVVVSLLSQIRRPIDATETRVVRPFISADATVDGSTMVESFDLVCSRTSLVSLRPDAHLCTAGDYYPVYDPCFEVSADIVSCSRPSTAGGSVILDSLVANVREFRDFYFDADRQKLVVPIDASLDLYYPWAIVLNQSFGGSPITCTVRYNSSDVDLPVSYLCGRQSLRLIPSVEGFISGSDPWMATFDKTSDGFEAFDLKREGDVWTIRAPAPGTSEFRDVEIVTAYF